MDLARELLGKIPDQMVIAGLKEKLVLIIQSYHFEVNKHHSCKKVGTSPNGSGTIALASVLIALHWMDHGVCAGDGA